VIWEIVLTPRAKAMLESIQDRRVRQKIRDRIDGLTEEPDKQGKPLTGELSGYRSLRAVDQRYRIIYRIEERKILVLVMALGIRKEKDKEDVYTLTQRLIRLRLLEPPQE